MRKHRSIFTIFILGFELNSDAIKKLQGDNNELVIIPGAVHTDLYYKMDVISFDKIGALYMKYLKQKARLSPECVIASLFSTNRLGRPILRGESGFYSCAVSLFAIFEFDDGYALYCVMLFV